MSASAQVRAARLAAWHLRRLGWPGWLGLVMLAAAAATAAVIVLPDWNRHEALLADIAAAEVAAAVPAASRPLTPQQQLGAFLGDLPRPSEVPAILTRINALAVGQSLALEAGEYAQSPVNGLAADQMRVTLPVRGKYPAIRHFVDASLAAVPALALQSVQIRRERIADDVVEARLVFVLFIGHPS